MGGKLSYYKVTKNFAESSLCSRVLWRVELRSDEIGYLAEAISKQSGEGAVLAPLDYLQCEKKLLKDRIVKHKNNLDTWIVLCLSHREKREQ